MLLLVIFSLVLRLIDANSESGDEEYGNAVTAGFEHIDSRQRSSSSESTNCPINGSCFKNRGVQISVDNVQKPLSCSQYDKQFTCSSTLRTHQQMHSGEKVHCSECGKQFKHVSTLQRHQQVHTGVKSFRCDVCLKQFAYVNSWRAHQRTHTGEKPFICPDCGKQFAHRHHLLAHQRTHTGEKPFTCPDCGKQFAHVCSMRTHQRKHTGEKPFTCPDCSKKFARACYLKDHRRKHSNEKRSKEKSFRCTKCGNRYAGRDLLYKHQRAHHCEKPFECLQCGKLFVNDDYLRDHQREEHAVFENFTNSSFIDYAESSSVEESPCVFLVLENSTESSSRSHLEDINDYYSSFAETDLENFVDSPSFVQIKNLTAMENFPFLHLKIPVDATATAEKKDSITMEDPFFLQSVLENPVVSSSLIQINNPTKLESPFLFHIENPIVGPSHSEDPMESPFRDQLHNPTTFGDLFLFQNSKENSFLVQKEEDTVEKLIDGPSFIQPDTNSVQEVPDNSPLLFPMQERMSTKPEDSMADAYLPSGDLDAVPDSAYLECPVCFGLFGGREALKDHLLNSSCSLFPVNW